MPKRIEIAWLTNHAKLRLAERSKLTHYEALRQLIEWTTRLAEHDPDGWLNPPKGWWRVPLSDGSAALMVRDMNGRPCLIATTIIGPNMASV